MGEEEALEIALVENLQRKDLTPFEEAEGYQSLADRHGYSHEQIAEAVGKSRTVVTEALSLLRMPPRARTAVQALGIQSRSTVLEVLKAARDEDEMVALLEQVAHGGLNRDDIRARSRSRSGPQPAAQALRLQVPLAGQDLQSVDELPQEHGGQGGPHRRPGADPPGSAVGAGRRLDLRGAGRGGSYARGAGS